ncbi:hypothetical protein NCLIV_038770 [Neospora caninum Liverpool]|uniref:Cysteine-rich secretory protein LCCL domain-containing 2 n=1 Tax=Neospora caninum (strain Liverpool) TaxID=572307 RepID=F0VAU4_NEOCL|nr:hypothetical protein NCLIV_038770 [Neospora caninum Liverpool]CBZ50802.1 hypothetical protein NCLIV_038770 [Neospora caninum Liverpool]CEL68103.1 TPA: Cysteine-rich secretory protein LCCL domain-containing 2 [Neospora caninum Liverpool]|eukprot:XP_003880835.1 hypothetical protein NCLIV_038770 [Neospora caninum Liverpool]
MVSSSPVSISQKWRYCVFLLCSLPLLAAIRSLAREWCKAVPEQGKPEYGVCVPPEFATARYTIEVVPVVAPSVNLRSQSHFPVQSYLLAGNKRYEVSVQTGADPHVGDLEAIVLANAAQDDPWYCDYLNVRTEDGSMFAFKVKRWVGKPYEQFVHVPLKPSDVDMPSQDIDCYTRAADIFNTRKGRRIDVVPYRIREAVVYWKTGSSKKWNVGHCLCNGQEASIEECTFEEPTAQCDDHTNDIVLKCTNTPSGVEPPVGTLRIVDTTGAPSLTGIGRLEFYTNGDESELRLCPHVVSDDIYCVHEEDIVVGCEGKGDPSGIGLFTIEEKPDLGVLPIKSVALTCSDRPISRRDMAGGPGTMFIASCPEGCWGSLVKSLCYSCQERGWAINSYLGFEGRPGSFVDASYLPGVNLVSGFRDFTLAVKATVTGKKGKWRAIVANGDCEGFILAIDNNDELVFEQSCHPHLIRSGFKPALGEPFNVAVTYFAPEKAVGIFVNGRKLTYQKTDYSFSLKPKLMIGRASATESDYFMGEITCVHLFDYVLSPAQIAQLRKEIGPVPEPGRVPRGLRRTEDGRVCISPCSPQEPSVNGGGRPPTNAPIQLKCEDTLLRPEFSGATGHKLLVSCPADCAHSPGPLHGCQIYSADSSICKAALHMGAIQRHGGEAVVTLHDGMSSYTASRGHYGVLSIATSSPQVLSFSVTSAPQYRALTCADNGSFVLKLGVGERELVICPPHCSAASNRAVYGAGLYSPISAVCRAAIHAGALTDEGGEVVIEAGPPHEAFVGSESFGITSQKSGSYLRSFAFVVSPSQQEL